MRVFWLLLAACATPRPLIDHVDTTPRLVAPGLVSTGDDDAHATLAPDGTLYFLKDTPSFDLYTIVYLRPGSRTPAVAPFSGQYPDGDLAFTPDGKHALFVSSRPVDGVARTDTDVWMVDVAGAGWSAPRHVAELSSPADEWFPTFSRDGTLYFGSCREGGQGGCDIYRSRLRADGQFDPPVNIGAPVNTPGNEIEPLIAPDGRYLVVSASGRADSLGSYDLYLYRPAPGGWGAPHHLAEPLNSRGWDFGARLSPDGRWLFFTSNRGFGSEPLAAPLTFAQLQRRLHAPGNGLRDIYVVDARVLDAIR
jgi:Tol biopolymer transport system component